MSPPKIKKENTNYSFNLACLAAIASSAVTALSMLAAAASLGIIGVVTAKAALVVSTAVTFSLFSSLLAPIVGVALIVGALCLLPFMCRGKVSYHSSYDAPYQPTFYARFSGDAHCHGHPSNHHGHPAAQF